MSRSTRQRRRVATALVVSTLSMASSPVLPAALARSASADPIVLHKRLVDRSRGTAARGSAAATPNRVLPTTVFVPAHARNAPLIVFAIGFNSSAAMYANFLAAFVRFGYVVAAPEFPLATKTLPGRPSQSDVVNEPGDVSFVISALVAANAQAGALHGTIDSRRIAVIGHSDGAIVASSLALNRCCIDRRVAAVVAISGDKAFMPASWTNKGTRPWLGIHGTADRVAPAAGSQGVYRTAGMPRYLILVDGAGHLDPTNDPTLEPKVVAVIREYLRRYLFANPRALPRMASLASHAPFHLAADPTIT